MKRNRKRVERQYKVGDTVRTNLGIYTIAVAENGVDGEVYEVEGFRCPRYVATCRDGKWGMTFNMEAFHFPFATLEAAIENFVNKVAC